MRDTPNIPKNPPGWEVRSEHQLFGHTVRMHQHRYMLVLQIDDLYLVAGVSEQGNITVPAKMAIVNDLDQGFAGFCKDQPDLGCSRIDRIFQQFFYCTGRTLNYFSRSYLVGNIIRQ